MKIISGIVKVLIVCLMAILLIGCVTVIDWSISKLLRTLVYLTIVLFILFYRNGNIFRYFWNDPQWMTSGQRLMANVGLVLAFLFLPLGDPGPMSDPDPSFTMEENNAIYMVAMVIAYMLWFAIGIGGAWMYRRAFRKNMPADPVAYEAELKYQEDMSTWMVLSEFNDPAEAHVLKNRLESNGVEVLLYGDNAPLYLGSGSHRAPVRLCVRRHQKETAERLVNE